MHLRVGVLAMVGLLSANPSRAYDCGEILQHGLWGYTVYESSNTQSETFRRWWCDSSTKQSSTSKDSGWSLKGAYDDVSAAFGHSDSKKSYSDFRMTSCGSNYSSIEMSNDVDYFSQEASAVIVNAWAECTTRGDQPGVRAWVEFPADPTKSRKVSLLFAYKSPAAALNSTEVAITSLLNLKCQDPKGGTGGLTLPHKFQVSEFSNSQFSCTRGSDDKAADDEAEVDFNVVGVPSHPTGSIYLPKIVREPVKRPFAAGLESATCVATEGNAWTSPTDKGLLAKSPKSVSRVSRYVCSWKLPGFTATKATFTIAGFEWDNTPVNVRPRNDGSKGGVHAIVLTDENSVRADGGSRSWRKQAGGSTREKAGVTAITGTFAAPTSIVKVEFEFRDSWRKRPVFWSILKPVLTVSTDDQKPSVSAAALIGEGSSMPVAVQAPAYHGQDSVLTRLIDNAE